jgi:hypothetical protein
MKKKKKKKAVLSTRIASRKTNRGHDSSGHLGDPNCNGLAFSGHEHHFLVNANVIRESKPASMDSSDRRSILRKATYNPGIISLAP